MLPKFLPILVPTLMAGGRGYTQQVLSAFGPNVIAYWPLLDLTGSQATDIGPHGYHGSYSGPTLNNDTAPDGSPAPTFTTDDIVNLYSAGMASAFDGTKGTLSIFFKLADASYWLDGAAHNMVRFAPTAANTNEIRLYKTTVDNTLVWSYRAGGTNKQRSLGSQSSLSWNCITIAWDAVADAVQFYLNGAPGVEQNSLGTWSGSPGSANSVAGAFNTSLTLPWEGSLAHVLLLNKKVSDTEAALLFPFDYSTTPRLLFTTDGGFDTQYNNMYPILSAKNIPMTAYIVTDWVGTAGYCTVEQLTTLQNAGWDIANHSKTHPESPGTQFGDLTQAEQETELSSAKSALEGWGFTDASMHFAAPQASYSVTTIAAMNATGILSNRNTLAQLFTPKSVNPFEISSYQITANTSVETAKGWIDAAIAQNKIVSILLHETVESSPTTFQWTNAQLTELAAYIETVGIQTITITDLYALF